MSLIDNDKRTLEQALKNSLPQAECVDILTAYFYFSGFSMLIDELKDKKIRILVGKAIDPSRIGDLSMALKKNPDADLASVTDINFDSKTRSARREDYTESFVKLMNSEVLGPAFDTEKDREAFRIFEDKMRDGTLEIKMTSIPNHAKVYILTNKPAFNANGDLLGCVFHGSNNFTYSGLRGQGEIATEDRSNDRYHEFMNHFNSLWNEASATIDIQTKNSGNFLEVIKKRSWIHMEPTPYEIYGRILKEMYSSMDGQDVKTVSKITDDRFSDLSYQIDAIKAGIDSINKHGGVIVADVVGLGKSVIASAISQNLNMERTVIISPPHLVPQWKDYSDSFKLRNTSVFSRGKMQEIYDKTSDDTPTLFVIDEAHYYRNEATKDYRILHKLIRSCAKNKVVLLSATPYNNHPKDVYALLKLFQVPGASTLEVGENLSDVFSNLISEYNTLDADYKSAGMMTNEIKAGFDELSEKIRRVISPIVIRRSRIDLKEIKKYADDLQQQGIEFPIVEDPILLTYDFGEDINSLYLDTVEAMGGNEDTNLGRCFTGAKYRPLTYITDENVFNDRYGEILNRTVNIKTTQRNMVKFARRLFATRLESSKGAFESTLTKMIESIEKSVRLWRDKGLVLVHAEKDISAIDNIEDIEELVDDGDGLPEYGAIPSEFFSYEYIEDLQSDLNLLRKIRAGWFENGKSDEYDPKFDRVVSCINEIQSNDINRKIVIFTQFSDTSDYVFRKLLKLGYRVMEYTGSSHQSVKNIISQNFDASWPIEDQKNNFDIIVATDALSEGFNLHRAGVVINYDIPYNPTRVIQRVGRINRINKKVFEKLYIYNFFPSVIGEEYTNVSRISNLKMMLINGIVGGDTKILDASESLRSFLKRQFDYEDEENRESSWDNEYRNEYERIKSDPELFNRINNIPERTRISRNGTNNMMIMFAKKANNIIFAINEIGETPKVKSARDILPYFVSNPGEPALSTKCSDEGFRELRNEILGTKKAPKARGAHRNAIDKLEIISHFSGGNRMDYIYDLIETIRKYDDLCEREIKYINNIEISDIRLDVNNVINELISEIPEDYLEKIREKATEMNSGENVVMFTESIVNQNA